MGARGNQDKCYPLTPPTILWDVGVEASAWFPTVCGIGLQGNFI